MKTYKVGQKLAIQICDGADGCGDIIKDYPVPQMCHWQDHDHQKKYRGKIKNAPIRRRLIVQILEVSNER